MANEIQLIRNSIQPAMDDGKAVIRFKENKIVRYLLDSHPTVDLNKLAVLNFSQDDRQHFAQLIGYSISGWSTLSYVDDDTYNAVKQMQDGVTETQARINSLQTELDYLRQILREPIARLYGIHPDDLKRT